MLGLTKNLRTRAAILIAVAYAFCVLAPSAALALVESPAAFHCLADLNAPTKQASAAHTHADGANHLHGQSSAADHSSDTGDKAHAGNCCGLFCTSAMVHVPSVTFGLFASAPPATSLAGIGLLGRAPSPLHRPPIA